ncbi:MAG: hypothetical protein E5X65_34685 [Mesorhizobium sp.]|nr:MAG: hypothetical protein E5X65_34685 [Mesorhizobium sp.]
MPKLKGPGEISSLKKPRGRPRSAASIRRLASWDPYPRRCRVGLLARI